MQRTVDRQLREIKEAVGKRAQGNRVDLHRVEAHAKRGVDTRERVFERAAARDLVEFLGIERVERDVHARKARGPQVVRHARQKDAVRGHRHVLDLGHGSDVAHELDHALAHRRLAAGKANAFDTDARSDANRLLNLFDAQDVEVGKLLHAFFGHAVHAAEVAAVGERNPQIVDCAAVAVLHIPLLAVYSRLNSIPQQGERAPSICNRGSDI